MAVEVTNMDMPTNCYDCFCCYDNYMCVLLGQRYFSREFDFDPSEARLPDCPLKPVVKNDI